MPGTYISPAETGLYYLQSRYYDPQVKRFVNADDADVVTATPASLNDKNLYAYCDNNPVSRVDVGGGFWDTVFDVVSLAFSIKDVIDNPDDPWAWAGLAGDTLDVLVPFVTGVGEITRAVNTTMDVIDAADDFHDAGKAAENFVEASKNIEKVATTGSSNTVGKIGEQLAGIDPKAKTPIQINGRTRIPDAMTDTMLTEVKNVKYISNTLQLRDFADYARATNRQLTLFVRPNTKVSRTVFEAGWDVQYLW